MPLTAKRKTNKSAVSKTPKPSAKPPLQRTRTSKARRAAAPKPAGVPLPIEADVEERDRIKSALNYFLPVLQQTKSLRANEADTAKIVRKFFQDVLGWDASEVTTEFKVKSTYTDSAREVNGQLKLVKSNFRDLAVRVGDKLLVMIEVRASGLPLRDKDVRSAYHFAAREGVPFVILTNGESLRLYRAGKDNNPADDLLFEIELMSTLSDDDYTKLYLLSRTSIPTNQAAKYGAKKSPISPAMLVEAIKSRAVSAAIVAYLKTEHHVRADQAEIKSAADALLG